MLNKLLFRADSKWLTSVRPRARTAAVLARLILQFSLNTSLCPYLFVFPFRLASSGKGPTREGEEDCTGMRRPSLGMIWEEEEEKDENECSAHERDNQTPAAAV